MKETLRFVPRRRLSRAALISTVVLAALAATLATGVVSSKSQVAEAATRTDTCGYSPNAAPKPGGGTVQFVENTVTRAISFYGAGLSGHVGLFTNDESGLLIGAGGTPSSSVGSTIGKLDTPIKAGTFITSISVAPPGLTVAVSANDTIVLSTPAHSEPFTAITAAGVGARSISVTIKKARGFAAGSNIADSSLYGKAVPPTFGSGTDLTGRAFAPEIYLTDITNDPSANGGDYEQGGTAANAGSPPVASALYGSWSPTVTVRPVNENHWNLGPQADTPPATDAFGMPTTSFDQGYSSEVVWNAASLKAWDPTAGGGTGGYVALQRGHTYRVQGIAHDTDQNQTTGGGDVGEVCTTFHIPLANSPSVSITKTADHSAPVTAGEKIGFTVKIKNNGPGDATGVELSDPLPAGSGSGATWAIDKTVGTPSQFVLSGAKGSQTVALTSSTLPAGANYTVHVTAQTSKTECSTYSNTATLSTGNANNPTASAMESCQYGAQPYCVTVSKVTPKRLFVGRRTRLTIYLTQNGKPVKGVRVQINGPKINIQTRPSGKRGVIRQRLKVRKKGRVTISPIAGQHCNNTQRVRVLRGRQYCVAVRKVKPNRLFVDRRTRLVIHLKRHHKPVKGVRVRIKGPKVDIRSRRSNRKGVIRQRVKARKTGIVTISPITHKRCNAKRIRVKSSP